MFILHSCFLQTSNVWHKYKSVESDFSEINFNGMEFFDNMFVVKMEYFIRYNFCIKKFTCKKYIIKRFYNNTAIMLYQIV